MATASFTRPPTPPAPPATFTLVLDETEAVTLAGVLGRVSTGIFFELADVLEKAQVLYESMPEYKEGIRQVIEAR